MTIFLKDNFELFSSSLESKLQTVDFIIFDFAVKYQLNNVKIGENKYVLNYSRSIPSNIVDALKNTFDYSYFYSVFQREEGVEIRGKIWPKKIVLISMLLLIVLFITLYLNDKSKDASPGILLFIVVFILSLLSIEYFLFRKKIKNFFNNII